MSYLMTGVITGSAVAGFTAPTYTLTADTAVDDNSRASVVTALGGTQAGVLVHTVSNPFMVIVSRPRTLRTLGRPNLNGLISNVGRNTYRILIRKGAIPLASQPYQIALCRIDFEIPAGSELADIPSNKALASFAGGFMNTNASGIADLFSNAVL